MHGGTAAFYSRPGCDVADREVVAVVRGVAGEIEADGSQFCVSRDGKESLRRRDFDVSVWIESLCR